jgi:hypothetical protein
VGEIYIYIYRERERVIVSRNVKTYFLQYLDTWKYDSSHFSVSHQRRIHRGGKRIDITFCVNCFPFSVPPASLPTPSAIPESVPLPFPDRAIRRTQPRAPSLFFLLLFIVFPSHIRLRCKCAGKISTASAK